MPKSKKVRIEPMDSSGALVGIIAHIPSLPMAKEIEQNIGDLCESFTGSVNLCNGPSSLPHLWAKLWRKEPPEPYLEYLPNIPSPEYLPSRMRKLKDELELRGFPAEIAA